MTPHSSGSHGFAYIRSSPGIELEITRHPCSDDIGEGSSSWQLPSSRATSQAPLSGIKSLFVDLPPIANSRRPLASEFASSYSVQHRQKASREPESSNTTKYASVFTDSEDEADESDSEGLSFVGTDLRSTFFRVSAERGQWRHDPPRLPAPTRAPHRQSAPTSSPPPISGLTLLARPISEPAPSTGRVSTPAPPSLAEAEDRDNGAEVPAGDIEADILVLTPDRVGSPAPPTESVDPEDDPAAYVSSPLPPSSPPLSSSLPASPMMRSISPLSFAPSSPHLPPSSPLSFFDSLPPDGDEPDIDMDVQSDSEADTLPIPSLLVEADLTATRIQEDNEAQDLEQASTSSESVSNPPNDLPTAIAPPIPESPASLDVVAPGPSSEPAVQAPTPSTPVASEGSPSPLAKNTEDMTCAPCATEDVGEFDNAVISIAEELFADEKALSHSVPSASSSAVQKGKAREMDGAVEIEALRTKDENGVKDGSKKEKRKKDLDGARDAPPKKKLKLAMGTVEASASASGSHVEKKKRTTKARKEAKRRLEEDEEENTHPAPKPKKPKKTDADASSLKRSSRPDPSTSSISLSTSKSKPSPQASSSKSQPISPKDPVTEEIFGMLIETMATSRASSMPASSLYKSALLTRPSLSTERPEAEWLTIIERVLHDGEVKGVFGKVESSFKDEAGRPLEAQWFYVPECDEDQDRAALVRSMMPRAGKRSETKKYKQYYYRPLAKISRWDPEDDL
ncbi:hypothetical protein C0991_011482 [Blastosporella zonata]|nr:hypothetical protein C0991_011482 [Blastosporella zonata]